MTFANLMAENPVEQKRYLTLLETLTPLQEFITGKRVLDFGASYGLSACALIELGAKEVVGVEPDLVRLALGRNFLSQLGFSDRVQLLHSPDTSALPIESNSFEVVLANAVFEHIPEPRYSHIREVWRVVSQNGVLIINETPNKYLPPDSHTTKLFRIPWLPSRIACRSAMMRRRNEPTSDWASCGWRGFGHFELVSKLSGRDVNVPHLTRPRHRKFLKLGREPKLLDPYPTWILRKLDRSPAAAAVDRRTSNFEINLASNEQHAAIG